MKILTDKKQMDGLAKEMAAVHNKYVQSVSDMLIAAAGEGFALSKEDALVFMSDVPPRTLTKEYFSDEIFGFLAATVDDREDKKLLVQIEELKSQLGKRRFRK